MNPIKTCMYVSFNQGLDMNPIETCMYVSFNQGLDEPYRNMYVCEF